MGSNLEGQLGNGNILAPCAAITTVRFSAGLQVLEIAANHGHSCALTASKATHCWGYNAYGQVGDGTIDVRVAPVLIP